MAHYYNPVTGKVETVNAAKKRAVDEYYGQRNKLNLARNPFFIVGIALALGIGVFGFKLKELLTLLKVEVSEKADVIIEKVTDPFQITGREEKAKFLSDCKDPFEVKVVRESKLVEVLPENGVI